MNSKIHWLAPLWLKGATVLIVALLAMVSMGCSAVGSGKYLVLESKQKGIAVHRPDWDMGIVEPTVGRFMPKLYENKFSEEISYIAYPIIKDLRIWALGPVFFPIIPAWWWATDTEDPNALYKMKIVWHGDVNLAQNILVIRQDGEREEIGKQDVIWRGTNELICSYLFKERFVDKSTIILTNQGKCGTEPLLFKSKLEICLAPIISINGPEKNTRP